MYVFFCVLEHLKLYILISDYLRWFYIWKEYSLGRLSNAQYELKWATPLFSSTQDIDKLLCCEVVKTVIIVVLVVVLDS